MSDQQVVQAALKLRVGLVAEIERKESDLRQKVIDLRGLDATLPHKLSLMNFVFCESAPALTCDTHEST